MVTRVRMARQTQSARLPRIPQGSYCLRYIVVSVLEYAIFRCWLKGASDE
jgi:hypothetical protein